MTPSKMNEIAVKWTAKLTEARPALAEHHDGIRFAIMAAIIDSLLDDRAKSELARLRAAGQPKSVLQPPPWLDEKPMVEALGCTVLEER